MEEQAEKILEKHVNEFDLNFIFHEKKELYNQLIDAVSEALNIHNVGVSLPTNNEFWEEWNKHKDIQRLWLWMLRRQ